jgi:YbbR domain-containing protein
MQNKKEGGRNALYIILAIVIAVGIWVYVDNTDPNTVTVEAKAVPVEYIGEDTTLADRGLMLLSDTDKEVDLKLEGYRNNIARLDTSKIKVQVDLSNVTSVGTLSLGPGSVRIVYPDSRFSNLISYTPFSVSVDVGTLYSKDVEIRCDIQGAVAEGYIAGEPQYEPKTLEIRGQESDAEQVSYAKVVLNIEDATETVTELLDYKFYDENDKEIDSANIRATTEQIQVVLPVYIVKELPLQMNFIEAPGSSLSNVDYTIEPQTITVSGDAAKMKDIDAIVLDDFSLAELSGATTYNYVITVPDGCENLSGVARATLKIAFQDMTTATATATRFEAENVPDGKTVTILTTELPVRLRGTTADVSLVTDEDLTVVADLTDVSSASGSYTVPATIRIDSGGDVGAVGSYQVKITISDGTEEEPSEP